MLVTQLLTCVDWCCAVLTDDKLCFPQSHIEHQLVHSLDCQAIHRRTQEVTPNGHQGQWYKPMHLIRV